MPKNEPDATDPMELSGVTFDDPTGQSVPIMAECFADEFLRLGCTPAQILDLFRSEEHRLANLAWKQLGEIAIYAMVHDRAHRYAQVREALRRSREARALRSEGV